MRRTRQLEENRAALPRFYDEQTRPWTLHSDRLFKMVWTQLSDRNVAEKRPRACEMRERFFGHHLTEHKTINWNSFFVPKQTYDASHLLESWMYVHVQFSSNHSGFTVCSSSLAGTNHCNILYNILYIDINQYKYIYLYAKVLYQLVL